MATPFPFSAIVGQDDMKLAIQIVAVDPKVGGVLALGDRGTGKSTKVTSKDFSTNRLAADAIAILDDLGIEKANVCGHSNGGRVAQVIALDYPARVERLLLASAGGSGSKKSDSGPLPLGMILEIIEKGYPGYARIHSIETGFTATYAKDHADRVEVLRGPSALLYGSSAIGGVVNVIDNRIPQAAVNGINARGETVAENGMFRSAFAARRCLVPIAAFYEWTEKAPHAIAATDNTPLTLGGVWEGHARFPSPYEGPRSLPSVIGMP